GLANPVARTILQDAKGFIWIGTANGLTRYDGYSCVNYRHVNNDPYSLSNNFIWAMCIDNEGTLWVGTDNGLNRFDAQNDRFDVFYQDSSNNNSPSDNTISAIAKDSAGNLWVGTGHGGLNVMTKFKKKERSNTVYEFIHYRYDSLD